MILAPGRSAPPKLVPLPEPRPLEPQERSLLEFLVESSGSDELRAQVAAVEVVATCACGCASIGLQGDGPQVSRDAMRRIGDFDRDDHAELIAWGVTPEERPVQVALHVSLGRIWELEVWSGPDDDVVSELPHVETLRAR
jgi:hypothetical protein